MRQHAMRMIRPAMPQPVRRSATTALAMLLFLALFAGAYPMYGGNLARTNTNPGETLATQLTRKFTSAQVANGVTAQPVVAPVSTANNDPLLGRPRWL